MQIGSITRVHLAPGRQATEVVSTESKGCPFRDVEQRDMHSSSSSSPSSFFSFLTGRNDPYIRQYLHTRNI